MGEVNIRDAITRIAAIQEGLSISSPVSVAIEKAWPYAPDTGAALRVPAWVNGWTLVSERRQLGNRSVFYTVHMQLYAVPATVQQQRAMDICTAFLEATLVAFDSAANRRLTDTVSRQSIRGNDPTIGVLEWGGQAYIGLDLFLDIEIEEARA